MTVENLYGTPHLTIALSAPLYGSKAILLANQHPNTPASLYIFIKTSNTGFNNQNQIFILLYTQAIQITFKLHSKVGILVIHEGRIRNRFYFESLAVLFKFTSKAGFSVPIGSFALKLKENRQHSSTLSLLLKPFNLKGNKSGCTNFYTCIACLVLWRTLKAIGTSRPTNNFYILN